MSPYKPTSLRFHSGLLCRCSPPTFLNSIPHIQVPEVVSQVTSIPGQQPVGVKDRVRANKEIGDNALCFAAPLEIFAKVLAGQTCALMTGWNEFQLPVGQEIVESLLVGDSRVDLGQYAFTHDQLSLQGCFP